MANYGTAVACHGHCRATATTLQGEKLRARDSGRPSGKNTDKPAVE